MDVSAYEKAWTLCVSGLHFYMTFRFLTDNMLPIEAFPQPTHLVHPFTKARISLLFLPSQKALSELMSQHKSAFGSNNSKPPWKLMNPPEVFFMWFPVVYQIKAVTSCSTHKIYQQETDG